MSWSVLQSASTPASSSASTQAVTYGTNLTSGTKLIAVVSVNSVTTTISTVKDGSGNSFTELVNVPYLSTLGQLSLWVIDTPAGDIGTKPTITASTVSGNALISILVEEVSGLVKGVNPEAIFNNTPGTLVGLGGSSTGSPEYESSVDSEFLISVYGDIGGETWSAPVNLATVDANSVNSNASANIAVAYGNSTDGTEGGSWGLTGVAAQWGTILVSMKLATGSAVVYSWHGPVKAQRPLPFRGQIGSNPGSLPSLLLLNSFDGGTNTTAISTGNSGGASGNAFSVINSTNGTPVFDSSHYAHGSLSCKIASSASGAADTIWNNSVTGNQAQIWFRLYLYFTAYPSSSFRLFQATDSASVNGIVLRVVGTTGLLAMVDLNGASVITTSTMAIPLNQWFRIEGFAAAGKSAGQIQLKIFSPQDNQVPVEIDTSAANLNLGLNLFSAFFYGLDSGVASIGPFWMDSIGLSNTGYIGPASFAELNPLTAPVRARILPLHPRAGGLVAANQHTPPYVPPAPPPPPPSVAPPVDSSALPSIITTFSM